MGKYVKTPLMFYRELFERAGVDIDTYLPAIAHGTLLLDGSETKLQDDFLNWEYAPSTFTRGDGRVPKINDTAVSALSAGANKSYLANTDYAMLCVGQPDPSQTLLLCNVGNGSTGAALLNKWTGTAGGGARDNVATTQTVAVMDLSASSIMPKLGGNNISLMTTIDAFAEVETLVNTKVRNMDTNAILSSGSVFSDLGATPPIPRVVNALSPAAQVRFNGWEKFFGSIIFAFPGSTLPKDTIEADLNLIAKEILALNA